MSNIVDHFDALVNLGLKPIPLKKNTKEPVQNRWQKYWDEERVRHIFGLNPTNNIGILLGEIVDVEGDTPEANAYINKLIGDYKHPHYKSSRSIHHLFLSPDKSLKILKYNDIEFRGYGHQSVVPPSTHHGNEYKWLDTDSFPVPPMPQKLLSFFKSRFHPPEQKGLPKGCFHISCFMCEGRNIIHQSRYDLELEGLEQNGIKRWACHSCTGIDLRKICRQIKSKKRRLKKRSKVYR